VAITASDVLFKLSINTGPGNSTAQPDPNDSLGRFMSSTQLVDATLHNLFDKVTGDENAASDVEYRVFFVHNAHATLTWEAVYVWVDSQVSGGASVAIGLDTTGVVTATSASNQTVARPANENTAPSGISFSTPTTKAGGILIGDIAAGSVQAVWVRRTAANTSAVDSDGAVVKFSGDTAA
jgi:hypothetical protein